MKNPKSETRNPKEVRNPKAEFEQQWCADWKSATGKSRLLDSDFGFCLP